MSTASTNADVKNVQIANRRIQTAILSLRKSRGAIRAGVHKATTTVRAPRTIHYRKIEPVECVSTSAMSAARIAEKIAVGSHNNATKARCASASSEKAAKKAIDITNKAMKYAREAASESKRTRIAMQTLTQKFVRKRSASAMKEASASVGSST